MRLLIVVGCRSMDWSMAWWTDGWVDGWMDRWVVAWILDRQTLVDWGKFTCSVIASCSRLFLWCCFHSTAEKNAVGHFSSSDLVSFPPPPLGRLSSPPFHHYHCHRRRRRPPPWKWVLKLTWIRETVNFGWSSAPTCCTSCARRRTPASPS